MKLISMYRRVACHSGMLKGYQSQKDELLKRGRVPNVYDTLFFCTTPQVKDYITQNL